MHRDEILRVLRESLTAITTPRFYETERGFQGELLAQLRQRTVLPDQAIIEQEYQKAARAHGLTCRPDIIMHEPYDSQRHRDRAQGNYAVIELKRRASAERARKDFDSISDMIRVLRYPLGIFINIGTSRARGELVSEDLRGQVACFATTLRGGVVHLVEG